MSPTVDVDAPRASVRGMLWPIKESFVDYVHAMPDGAVSVSRSAGVIGDAFLYPLLDASAFDSRTGHGTLSFSGDVRFAGHSGMMFVAVADPRIEADSSGARLTVADPAAAGGARIVLAELGTPRQETHGGGLEIPVVLAEAGVAVFNGVYPEGTQLSPLHVRGV